MILRHRREMFREMGGQYAQLLEQFEAASRNYFQLALAAGRYYGVFAEQRGEVVAGEGVVIADWPGSPLNFEPKRAWIFESLCRAAGEAARPRTANCEGSDRLVPRQWLPVGCATRK
jgi:hypothetical protein